MLDASFSQGGDGNSITAMYDVAAPAGGWVNTDNGIYTVTVTGERRSQPNRNSTGSGPGASQRTRDCVSTAESQFLVAVDDSLPPALTISAPNVAGRRALRLINSRSPRPTTSPSIKAWVGCR